MSTWPVCSAVSMSVDASGTGLNPFSLYHCTILLSPVLVNTFIRFRSARLCTGLRLNA